MRKTKIVCTIGPACESSRVLEEMYFAGINVARLTISHGTHDEHQIKIDAVKSVREKLNVPLTIILGSEYHIGVFENGPITLNDGKGFSDY